MITIVDEDAGEVVVRSGTEERKFPLASAEGFAAVSRAWLLAAWDARYAYSFTWLGRPVIQLPEDLLRMQEVIHAVKPDVLIETGVAHGGSLIFYATLFHAMGRGRVIGVDIDIRPDNRMAIESHALAPLITLIQGSSIAPEVVARVKSCIAPGEKALVILDSSHAKQHVLEELRAYSPLVAVGSYIVATDGVMEDLADRPRADLAWRWNNPKQAAQVFLRENPDFRADEPVFPFNEGLVSERVTYWPSAFIRRLK